MAFRRQHNGTSFSFLQREFLVEGNISNFSCDSGFNRVSGAIDGARLPKEVFYGLQVAQNTQPQVYVVGHWNYPSGTVKRVYVVSNTAKVKLEVLDPSGNVIKDYGFGKNDFAAPANDQVNHYCYAFDNVAFQPGTIKATGYDETGKVVATEQKSTAGVPAALKLTPVMGPSGKLYADGNDVAMFDVEVLDAKGNRCPTFEDSVDFTCSGEGVFLGGYNSGIRYSTNDKHLTTGYHLVIECGINRVFVRSTRKAGTFTLNVSRPGLTPATQTITSEPVLVAGGLMTNFPQLYNVALGPEPAPMKAEGPVGDLGTGSIANALAQPAAPALAQNTAPTMPAAPAAPAEPAPAAAAPAIIVDFAYSGANPDAEVAENAQKGSKVYKDSDTIAYGDLPAYLAGAEYVRPYQSDATEGSSTDQYQFNLLKQSYVYLLIDSANDMPDNNNNDTYKWEKLPEKVTINDRPMTVYKSRLMQAKDNVYLATNAHGVKQFDPKSNMYLVLVTPAGQPSPAVQQQPAAPQPQPTSQAAPAPAASGMTATASSSDKKNTPEMAIDGNSKTHWAPSPKDKSPQWLKIDLGKTWNVTGYNIEWHRGENHAYQYLIEVSDDDKTYQVSVDQQANTTKGNINDTIQPGKASKGRYVRLTMKEGGRVEIDEFHINGAPVPGAK